MEEKKKILIVEDEASIAELEKDYLELSGFQVETEGDGEKAFHPGTAGTEQKGMCGKRQGAAHPGQVCAGIVRRYRYAAI